MASAQHRAVTSNRPVGDSMCRRANARLVRANRAKASEIYDSRVVEAKSGWRSLTYFALSGVLPSHGVLASVFAVCRWARFKLYILRPLSPSDSHKFALNNHHHQIN